MDVDSAGRLLPSPPKALPFQRQLPPFSQMPGPSNLSMNSAVWGSVTSVRSAVKPPELPARPPLTPVDGNADVVRQVMAAEVRALERKLKRADLQVKVQEQLIRGFCKLEVARRDECGD